MRSTVAQRLENLERRVSLLEGRPPDRGADRPPALQSPREFLMSHTGAKRLADLGLLAGYFIEVISGKESFTLDELNEFYSQAKEPRPKAYRDVPYQNVRRGVFRQVGKIVQSRHAHNRWALTNLGIARVEGGFADAHPNLPERRSKAAKPTDDAGSTGGNR